MNFITFDKLPEAVAQLLCEIAILKELVISKNNHQQPEDFKLLSIKEAAAFLNLSVPTVYGKVSKAELPVMKRGKRLYFSRLELTEYLKQGRKKTNTEIEESSKEYLLTNKKGLNYGK
jgi:excisionase family DNA binding protein